MTISEISIATIPHFLVEVMQYPSIAWAYRGQEDIEWKLVPKAGRPDYFLPKPNKLSFKDAPPRDVGRFNHWRKLAVAYHKDLPENDFECLAFAQHYGLAMRLLDWSSNPLTALFFAVDSCSSIDGVVYAFSPSMHVDIPNAKIGYVPEIVCQLTPPPFDVRILVQNGVFTYHPQLNLPLEAGPVQDLSTLTPEHGSNLVRFRIPANSKRNLKVYLDEIGVNRKSLFPNLCSQI